MRCFCCGEVGGDVGVDGVADGLGAVEGGDRGDPLVVADEGDVDCHVGGADGGGEEEEVDVAVVGEDVGQVVGD